MSTTPRRSPPAEGIPGRTTSGLVPATTATGTAVAVLVAVLVGHGPLIGFVAAATGLSVRGAVRRMAARRYRAAVRDAAEDVLAAVVTELEAGAPPDRALRHALTSVGDLPARPRAGSVRPAGRELRALPARLHEVDDPADALGECEASSMRQLGAVHRVSQIAGVRMAPVAALLADTARADAIRADELDTALAGPRSSGRLVAALPAVGLALGTVAGAAPVDVLLSTSAGSACLVLGVLLDLAGLRWLRWIAEGVERRAGDGSRRPPGDRLVRPGRPGVGTLPGALPTGDGPRELLTGLPLALDLTAACLRSGGTTVDALRTVGEATGGRAGTELVVVSRALRQGATMSEACRRLIAAGHQTRLSGRLAGLVPERPEGWQRPARFHSVGRAAGSASRPGRTILAVVAALERSESSGAKLATTLSRIAERARQESHAAAIAAARRAGVAAVAPLGLCFLPAFLLLGVGPMIIGSVPALEPL